MLMSQRKVIKNLYSYLHKNLVFALQNKIQPLGVELTITKFIWQQCKLELCSFKLKSLTSQCNKSFNTHIQECNLVFKEESFLLSNQDCVCGALDQ